MNSLIWGSATIANFEKKSKAEVRDADYWRMLMGSLTCPHQVDSLCDLEGTARHSSCWKPGVKGVFGYPMSWGCPNRKWGLLLQIKGALVRPLWKRWCWWCPESSEQLPCQFKGHRMKRWQAAWEVVCILEGSSLGSFFCRVGALIFGCKILAEAAASL